MSDFDDFEIPPPPPLEDEVYLPSSGHESEKKPMKPAPPPRRNAKKKGPPPVIPRTMDARKSSIAIRNNLLFRLSETPIGAEEFPPSPPRTKPVQNLPTGNNLGLTDTDNQQDSSAYSLMPPKEKPKLDIKVDGNVPLMTLKAPNQKVFDGFGSDALDTVFKPAPIPVPKIASKPLPVAPNYSEYDRKIFEAINRARTKPTSFISLLQERLSKFEDGTNNLVIGHNSRLVTHEGPAAVNEAIAFLQNTSPVRSLAWHNVLAEVCKEHVEEIGAAGLYEHKMKDGSQPTDKALERLTEKVSTAAESIKFSSDDALTAVVDFIVDDGVQSRGNRGNIFGDFDLMGCFTGLHTISDTMTTLLFVQNASTSSNILQTLIAKVNEQVQDPPNWAQKQQKVLFNGDEITVTNHFLMKDGSQKTVEIKRKVQGTDLL